MKKKYSFVCITFILTLLLGGCINSSDKVAKIISAMQSEPVTIPFDRMSCWINDSIQNNRPWENADLKLVVYTDSFNCSQCTLKKMYLWKDFVKLEQKYPNKFYIFFIIQSGPNSTYALSQNFHYTELNHPVYVDSTNVFIKTNPHIPAEEMFHVFLLNEKDSIVLVGNPLFNPQIEDLLIKQVDDRIKKLLTKKE